MTLNAEQRFIFLGSQKGFFKKPVPSYIHLPRPFRGGSGDEQPNEQSNVDIVYP